MCATATAMAAAALAGAGAASADHSAGSPQISTVPPPPPAPSAAPSINDDGTPRDQEQLSANQGTWAAGTSLSNQWLRCDSGGSACVHTHRTGATYDLGPADVGLTIRLRVRGETVLGGFREVDSAPTAVIAAIPTANTAPPQIGGTAREGEILFAINGSWEGTQPLTYSYVWKRCDPACTQVVATSSSYAVAAADVGHQLELTVTASGPGGSDSGSVMSGVVAARPAPDTGGGTTGAGTTPGSGSTGPQGTSGTVDLRMLSPFPVIAIGGRILGRSVIVSQLRVSRAPRGATVTVTCKGRSCPFRRARRTIRRRAGIRLRSLERRLRSGTVIVIVVRKGNTIGKYTRLRIRRRAAPARVDRCIRPGARRPSTCPG